MEKIAIRKLISMGKELTKEQKIEYTYKQFLKAKRRVIEEINNMDTFMKIMYRYA